jgi:hypothetical protein
MAFGAGFYKQDTTELRYAPNSVIGPGITLIAENHVGLTYPVNGWYWFDTVQEAFDFFGVPYYTETALEFQDRIDARSYAKLKALVSLTPTQIQNYIQNNVNTLADAKDALKTLAIAVGILARRL